MQMMTSYAKLALLIGVFAWAQGAHYSPAGNAVIAAALARELAD